MMLNSLVATGLLLLLGCCGSPTAQATKSFNRIATLPICTQVHPTCNMTNATNAEIVDVSKDGKTLVYSDSEMGAIGFADVSNPSMPVGIGFVLVDGEPTTVQVFNEQLAVAAVNTSPNLINTTGDLLVIDIASQSIVTSLALPGQPDSVAVSPDMKYIAVAIENERNETIVPPSLVPPDNITGSPPQLPAGSLVIVQSSGEPSTWTQTTVSLLNLPGLSFPTDPEPEYVAINDDNIVVVTLQENNAIVLVDAATGTVVRSFSAGSETKTLTNVDATEDGRIQPNEVLTNVLREPDAVSWIGTTHFVTANEGDFLGGSRGFTIWTASGQVVYDSGNSMDLLCIQYGHYPEGRSDAKGNEPENAITATFNGVRYLFVLSERSSLVFVYDLSDLTNPEFLQVLPAGVGPEGIVAIPERNLLVVASEVDERLSKIRSSLVIYELSDMAPTYPVLVSADRADGTPIPFSALSGLASGDPMGMPASTSRRRRLPGHSVLYSVEDSAFLSSRIFQIDVATKPYVVQQEWRITDASGLLADALESFPPDPINGTLVNLTNVINDDNTVNLDPEGIAVSHLGGFWIASEGAGTVGDVLRPYATPNMLLKLSDEAVIEGVVFLPEEANMRQVRFGLEGVAEQGDYVVAAVQRAWAPEVHPRLFILNQVTGEMKYVFYPLDPVESQFLGWVGLSDISPLGNGKFLVLERDNQGGPDASIKRIYEIDLGDFSLPQGTVITKTLFRDVYDDLALTNGMIYEKIEGLAVSSTGEVWLNNDNDGVDDNNGEQQLWNLGTLVESTDDAGDTSSSASASVSFVVGVIVAAATILFM